MAKKSLWTIVLISLILAGCSSPAPTLDIVQIQTIARQTAIVEATRLQFETQVAGLTQGPPPATATALVITMPPPTATPVLQSTLPAILPTAEPIRTLAPRPGGDYIAEKLTIAPTLDGIWDEWETTKYPIPTLIFNRTTTTWEDAADLEGSFRIGYDAQYLYIAVKANDNVYVQKASGKELFKGDSIELLLDMDLNGDYTTAQINGDDYQLGISPGNPNTEGVKEAYLWYPQSISGPRTQVLITAVSTGENWRIEAAIPWSMLGVAPTNGLKIGFAISISDNDDKDNKGQDSMISTASSRNFTDPTTWGTLTLR